MGKGKPRSDAVIIPRSDDQLRELLKDYVRRADDAFATVSDMSAYDPDQCWRFLEIARNADLSDKDLAYISAGPFEDLMKRHGKDFIDRVEASARQDSRMRYLIATVWRAGMSNEIWGRLEGLRASLGIKRL